MKKILFILFTICVALTFFSCPQIPVIDPVVDQNSNQFFQFDVDGEIPLPNKYVGSANYSFSIPITFYQKNPNAASNPTANVVAILKAVQTSEPSLLDVDSTKIADKIVFEAEIAEGTTQIEVEEFEVEERGSYIVEVKATLNSGKEFVVTSNKFDVILLSEELAASKMSANIEIEMPSFDSKKIVGINSNLDSAKIVITLSDSDEHALFAGIVTNATLKSSNGAVVKSLLTNEKSGKIENDSNTIEYNVELGNATVSGELYIEVVVTTPNSKEHKEESSKIFVKDLLVGKNFDSFYVEQTYGDDPEDSNYVVVFQDDFNTPHRVEGYRNDGTKWVNDRAPDPAKWDLISDFANNPYVRHDFSYIEDGKLKIKAEKANWDFYGYPFKQNYKSGNLDMSGRIQSKEKFGFLYGKMTVDFVLPAGNTWPAIWLLANSERGWDELDFIEYYPAANKRLWDVVFHRKYNWAGTGSDRDGYNYAAEKKFSEDLNGKNIHAQMIWTESNYVDEETVNSDITIKAKIGSGSEQIVCSNSPANRQTVPMYPIIEIQNTLQCWRGTGQFNSSETMSVDNIRVSQLKSKRYATKVDPLYNLDNVIANSNIRQGEFRSSDMSVDGITMASFYYQGQPRYENSLLTVKQGSTGESYVIYKAKNLKGVNLTVYYPDSMGITHNNKPSGDKLFTIEGSKSLLSDSWEKIDISIEKNLQGNQNKWNGRDEAYGGSYTQVTYHKIKCDERKYDYLKIKFPTCADKNKIYLGAVVLTRYEGDSYSDYKAEWE